MKIGENPYGIPGADHFRGEKVFDRQRISGGPTFIAKNGRSR